VLSKLELFLHDKPEPTSPLVKAAIVHASSRICSLNASIHSLTAMEESDALCREINRLDLGYTPLLSLAKVISLDKREYYKQLATHSKSLDIGDWIQYFSKVILDAQKYSCEKVLATIQKAKIFEKFDGQLNVRQSKLINKIFDLMPDEFKGGISAENYLSMNKCSRATATRDLKGLLDLGLLVKTGELKHTRYYWSNKKA